MTSKMLIYRLLDIADKSKPWVLLLIVLVTMVSLSATSVGQERQRHNPDSLQYKKRVLEQTEINIIGSYYTQVGKNAAVTGGKGNEDLQDTTGDIIISVPLSADDVLSVSGGISAYTSASSSNIDPFDGKGEADADLISSGESAKDLYKYVEVGYSHSSDSRDRVWNGGVSYATEYDYTSFGINGSYSMFFNKKNTEVGISASLYFDSWKLIYPTELRGSFNAGSHFLTGNISYSPSFEPLSSKDRNSYTVGVSANQIFSQYIQGGLIFNWTLQSGQLSNPFQRVYFRDVADSFIDKFHLADDIERLPERRMKIAIGGRLHFYINEYLSLRTYLRYYNDDWSVNTQTVQLELPVKVAMGRFTFYPSYRYYRQQASKYFGKYNQLLSTDTYYTSDYDLGEYNAQQLGFGVSYFDLFSYLNAGIFSFKNIGIKYYRYMRNTSFSSHIVIFSARLGVDY